MRSSREIEELCKKLKPVIGKQAEILWYIYLSEDEKNRKKLAQDIELLAERLLKQEILTQDKILLPPPSENDSSGPFLLGNIIYNQKELHSLNLRHEDFIKQVGIFAVTGEGKTNLAYLLALQLLKKKIPFMVIDWKRSWRNLLSLKEQIPELKDVQVFTIGREVLPFLWNPFRNPPGSDKELWISTIADTLEKSHMSGPGVAYYFNRIYPRLMKSLNHDFFPNFFDGLREIENVKAIQRELQWKQTAQRIFHSFTLGSSSKAFNSRNPVKLEDLLNKPVILELDLELPKYLRIFLTEIILRWIHLYRLNQGETDELRHVLFLEEVHNLFSEKRVFGVKETNSLENVYREIRAFGQGIISITQHPSLLPIYLLGNCHVQIYLGLQHADDIMTARKSLFLKLEEEPYLNLLKTGQCIAKIKNRINPCLVKIPLVPVKKGEISDEWLKVNTPSFLPFKTDDKKPITPSYLPPDIKENNQNRENSKNPDSSNHLIKNGLKKLLIDIFKNPFSTITRRYKNLNINPKYGNKYKNQLIAQGFIQPQKITTEKGMFVLFDLTTKGKVMLRDIGYEYNETYEGIVHKFWKFKIADYYKNLGYEVLVEEIINGRPDIIVKNKNNGKKAAIEIETGKSNYIENIQRDLKAGFDEVICLATSPDVEEKIRRELEQKKIISKKLRVICVLELVIK